MNSKGYKNFADIDGIATMCQYYDSIGEVKKPDGPVCKYSPQKNDLRKRCEHFFDGGVCINMEAHDKA
jgi:hypothetical protein